MSIGVFTSTAGAAGSCKTRAVISAITPMNKAIIRYFISWDMGGFLKYFGDCLAIDGFIHP